MLSFSLEAANRLIPQFRDPIPIDIDKNMKAVRGRAGYDFYGRVTSAPGLHANAENKLVHPYACIRMYKLVFSILD